MSGYGYRYASKDFFGPDAKSLMPPPAVPSTQEEVMQSNSDEITGLCDSIYIMMKWYFTRVGIINKDGMINRDNVIKMWPQYIHSTSQKELYDSLDKRIHDLTTFAILYYIPCKNNISGLTIDEFAIAFLLYYMSAKGGEWDRYFTLTGLGMDVARIQRCQIFLTNFDTLSEKTYGSEMPDNPMELTRTLYRNYGGKRRKSSRVSKSIRCKSRKGRKGRNGVKQKSRRFTSH